MIWIRLFIPLLVGLMVIYYVMMALQCFTNFKMSNRKITMGRCLVPFYYWIAPVNEKKRRNSSDYADEDEDESLAREEKIKNELHKNKTEEKENQ